MDPYKILGVSPDATDEEIKKAYRALAKKYHRHATKFIVIMRMPRILKSGGFPDPGIST